MPSTANPYGDNPYKDISKYVLKVIILNKLRDWNYPYAIANDIKEGCKEWHGKGILSQVTKSDVYNSISSLEKQGYVSTKTELKAGRVHKYYKTTKRGLMALNKAKKLKEEMINAFALLMGDN